MNPAHVVTKDSISVVIDGEAYTIKKGDPNFGAVGAAVKEKNWKEIPSLISKALVVKQWAGKAFEIRAGGVYYRGDALPGELNTRIVKMAQAGDDPRFLMRFWERLQRNPSWRSVQQLYAFLMHSNIPITRDGCFLAYKGVNSNYTDRHTGTVDNTPGALNEMPRNKISDDPEKACDQGYHVGALSYARPFGPVTVVCKVDPGDVVCIPKDSSQQKIRLCRYIVVGNYGSELPDTIYNDDDDDLIDAEILAALKRAAAADIPKAADTPKKPKIDMPPPLKKAAAGASEPHTVTIPKRIEDFTLKDLRSHAMALGITGASKVPGGKEGLLDVIRVHTRKQGGGAEVKGFDAMTRDVLLQQSLDALRKYAGHDLLITGASKIPGGKEALVDRIIDVRGTKK